MKELIALVIKQAVNTKLEDNKLMKGLIFQSGIVKVIELLYLIQKSSLHLIYLV